MLRRHDGFDDIGNVVDIGEGFNAEEDVVEWLFRRMCGVFRRADDWSTVSVLINERAAGEDT